MIICVKQTHPSSDLACVVSCVNERQITCAMWWAGVGTASVVCDRREAVVVVHTLLPRLWVHTRAMSPMKYYTSIAFSYFLHHSHTQTKQSVVVVPWRGPDSATACMAVPLRQKVRRGQVKSSSGAPWAAAVRVAARIHRPGLGRWQAAVASRATRGAMRRSRT
jgi:hypothetical protein